MPYQIWLDPKTGEGGLFDSLGLDEQGALSMAGLQKIMDIDTNDKEEAQQKFIEWCHQQCPDAKVKRVSFSALLGKADICTDGSRKKGGSRS